LFFPEFWFNWSVKINLPKNDAKYHWTNHVAGKMVYYGLSADRVKRVMRNPYRSEKGIAPDTIAVMQPGKTTPAVAGKPASWKEEIWVMYAEKAGPKGKSMMDQMQNFLGKKKVVITAWRYPGKSPIREAIPIPSNILEELKNIKY
jgi:hypothetical protein